MGPAPRALIHNWRLKLSALGLSVFLWALVQTEPRDEESVSAVPVRVEVADTGWTLSGAPTPATVELRLGGPARDIIGLIRDGTTIRVPVDAVGSTDTIVTLHRDWVELGDHAGVTVQSVSPSSVALSFEPAAARSLPVAIRLRGRLQGDVALASEVGVTPAVVRVWGPASRVSGLDSIPLEPFDLSRVGRSGVYTVAVDMSSLDGGRVTPATATLGVRVEEQVERTLPDVPVVLSPGEGESGLVAEPSTIQIRLRGARSVVTALDPERLGVSVAPDLLQGMTTGETRRVPVRLSGVPELVVAVPGTDFVTVRRSAAPPRGPGRQHER